MNKLLGLLIATKAYSLGTSVEEEGATLEGSAGVGLGVDVGYKLGAGFSVEVDVAYVLEKKTTGEETTVKGSFTTTSLDVAYIHHITHELEAFIKGGYEYELSHTSAIALEYEGTTIEGPRGYIASLGYVYSF